MGVFALYLHVEDKTMASQLDGWVDKWSSKRGTKSLSYLSMFFPQKLLHLHVQELFLTRHENSKGTENGPFADICIVSEQYFVL